jgi:hypothetical protein
MSITIDADLRGKLGAAREQGQRPTCLVFAVSGAHEFRRGVPDYLSPEYLHYAGAQRSHKDPAKGLSRPFVREALKDDGQPLDAEWPYAASAPAAKDWKPPPSVQNIHKATIDFVVRTLAEVRALLQSKTPVTLHLIGSEAMHRPDSEGVVRVRKRDKTTTRHALLAVGSGHDDDGGYILVRNSWGTAWGLAGHGWFHEPYLEPRLEMTGTIT